MDIISIIIVAVSIIFYVFELLPIAVIAMSSAALMIIFGVTSSAQVWAAFSSEPVLLIAGSSVVGSAFFSSGATKIITGSLVKLAKGRPNLAVYLMIIISGLLSSVMNNITSAIIFLPLIASIVAKENSDKIYEQKYMQLLAIVVSIGGMLALVGSAVVMIASGLSVASGGTEFTFFQFTPIGVILFIALIIYIFAFNDIYSDKIFANKIGKHSDFFNEIITDIEKEQTQDNLIDNKMLQLNSIIKDKRIITTAILLLMILGFITSDIHGISLGTIAVSCALLTVITGCFTIKEMIQKIDLNVVLTIVGMTGTAVGFAESGGSSKVVSVLLGFLGTNTSYIVIYVALCLIAAIMTQFISNTGTVGIIIPIAASLALQLGVNPTPFIMGVTLCSICSFMTPMANPIQAMIMNWGSYSFNDYVKYALPLTLISVLISIVFVPVFYPF